MQQTGISGRPRWAVALAGLGGLLMVIGAILPFVTGSAGGPFEGQSLGGLDTPDGKLYLGVGIGLIVFAFLIWAVRSPALRRILGVLVILASGFMIYAGIVDISDVRDQAEVDIGTGLYIVLMGSIIGVVGGVLSLISTGSAREAPPPPAEPSMAPPPIPEPPSEPSSP
jgi:uncharacterized membrane protein YfcA